ncbi:MAG: glycosyltransferase, partial [Kiloniellaceae bacterium]
RRGVLGPLMRPRMQSRLRHLLADARLRFAISPAMAEAYRARYGQPFEVFQNTLDVAARAAFAKPEPTVGDPAEILYVGSIFPNAQLDSLVECARAVVRLADQGERVRLVISSPSGHAGRYRHRLPDHPAVIVEPTIRDDDSFFRRIAGADLLLLPVNFDADSVRFICYSMPTKVPAYLISGTPILAYGPSETAQVAYARDGGWARVVGERGVEGLAAAMLELLTDMPARRRLVTAAQETARRNHDVRQVRSRFQALIAEAAGVRPPRPAHSSSEQVSP